VVAKAPGADVFLLLEQVEMPAGGGIENVARTSMQGAGFRMTNGSRTTINGLDAFVGVYDGQLEGLGPVITRAAHIVYGESVYLVAGFTAPNLFQQSDAAFASIRSFKSISAAEAESIHPTASTSTSCGRATRGSRLQSALATSSRARRSRS
jgi:hypothetical protein